MENFYNLLNIVESSSNNDIIIAYKNKISKYNNINNFSEKQISEIKLLKTGFYILSNPNLRKKYNNMINYIDEPSAENHKDDMTMDQLFNVDNSWMSSSPSKNDPNKDKLDSNVIGDRIFSLSHINKRPGYSPNSEIELRKQSQGRIEKN